MTVQPNLLIKSLIILCRAGSTEEGRSAAHQLRMVDDGPTALFEHFESFKPEVRQRILNS